MSDAPADFGAGPGARTLRGSRAWCRLGWVVVALVIHASLGLAEAERALPAPQLVPLHAAVTVSSLAAADETDEGAVAHLWTHRRLFPDPEALERLKTELRQAPAGPSAVPNVLEDQAPRVVAPALSVTRGFEGLTNTDNGSLAGTMVAPSDATLGMGPSHVFQMVNLVGRISDRSGVAVSSFSLRSFFQVSADFEGLSDPRVVFDPGSQRWFATIFQFSRTRGEAAIALAVSTTSDPTGTFCIFRLGNPTSEGFLTDFPQVGVSNDKVIVAYNGFSFGTPMMPQETFIGAGYYVVNKNTLVTAGCPASISMVRVPPDVTRFGIYPAVAISSTATAYMAKTADAFCAGQVQVVGVNGAPGAGAVTEDVFVLNVRPWCVPPDAQQPGLPLLLSTNDNSVITAVWQNGQLWLGGNERCLHGGEMNFRSCLRLVQINTVARTVQQDMTAGVSGQYYYYPALSPDGAGNLIVVFNSSSTSEFASVRATGRVATDPPNTLVPSLVLRAGGGAQTTSSRRFGDYYGAAIDPADPSKVWVTAEYVRTTASANWGTFVAQLTFGIPPPTLGFTLNAHAFTTGSLLRIDRFRANTGPDVLTHFYFGAAAPPAAGPSLGCPLGDALVFVTPTGFAVHCLSGSPAAFPVLASEFLPADLPMTVDTDFFTFTWPSTVPAGTYTVFMAFTRPGSLADGRMDPGDVIVLTTDTLTFTP